MKINGTNGIDIARAYANKAAERKRETESRERTESVSPVKADSVEFSSRAKELQSYRLALADMPPVREELVSQLRQKIQDGSFVLSERLIVEGIAQEMKNRLRG
ncbi:MAG: flagellar biosynthesis anti-sigma factor FlgM [Eubacteriales bacterium]|nr:flagellar biosynthesis anti-sigma factor FlgM [Bacillota bacterium]MBV1727710.1 flagellar biosynthesis anti-sigma factor FlgM [Desulforudis sp.]MDP3049875.1 flagellar biosynthesis anti-sigma factor FlgM [Eubacteriales bacterium]MDQ7789261.1 flagellar biosynthesis anti-sigma factor FlgM [Clostridia bacterium]MBU4532772.1 flagellar biosynthesis anti-sigma factor FlgM [Bacillota bacterium]